MAWGEKFLQPSTEHSLFLFLFFSLLLCIFFLSVNPSFFLLTCRCLKSLVTELSHFKWVAGHSQKWNLVRFASSMNECLSLQFQQFPTTCQIKNKLFSWGDMTFISEDDTCCVLEKHGRRRIAEVDGEVRGWYRGRGGGEMICSSSVKADELRKLVTSEEVGAQVDVWLSRQACSRVWMLSAGRSAGSERVHTDKARG